jgi:hypothetical protein
MKRAGDLEEPAEAKISVKTGKGSKEQGDVKIYGK